MDSTTEWHHHVILKLVIFYYYNLVGSTFGEPHFPIRMLNFEIGFHLLLSLGSFLFYPNFYPLVPFHVTYLSSTATYSAGDTWNLTWVGIEFREANLFYAGKPRKLILEAA